MTPEQQIQAKRAGSFSAPNRAQFNPMLQDPEIVAVQMRPDGALIMAMSKVGLTRLRQIGELQGGWEAARFDEQAAHLMMTVAMVDEARRIKAQRVYMSTSTNNTRQDAA